MKENEHQNRMIEYLLHDGQDKSPREALQKGFTAEQGNF